ncbi:GntR family transcriptional regulator [Vibrio sp. RE86]|uniref:GntR family transcriptional regulator n=1 Tax=Vibrio sp. RE86 TaxID=2607605 RepID=UPI001493A635|nr:GntR family transcriptional regulator [Vibrio sp. RE86]NOH78965.1 GntR family transcriptional regulator [Vibrio sp. RE86]
MSQTKSAIIYERIKRELSEGVLQPGQKLNISHLKNEYDVSLTPLREALSQLSAQGLLEQQINKGFSVPKLSYRDILEIRQTRILVETEALRLSLNSGDMDWESKLVAAHYRLERLRLSVDHLDAWSEAHEEFHSILLSGADSTYLIDFSKRLGTALDKYRRISDPDTEVRAQLDRQHKQLLDLALSRDIEGAVEVLTSHIVLSCQSAVDQLTEHSPIV